MRPSGGDEEDRTPDPLLAKQVLSQLSYTPAFEKSLELFFFPGLSPHFKLPSKVSSKPEYGPVAQLARAYD